MKKKLLSISIQSSGPNYFGEAKVTIDTIAVTITTIRVHINLPINERQQWEKKFTEIHTQLLSALTELGMDTSTFVSAEELASIEYELQWTRVWGMDIAKMPIAG